MRTHTAQPHQCPFAAGVLHALRPKRALGPLNKALRSNWGRDVEETTPGSLSLRAFLLVKMAQLATETALSEPSPPKQTGRSEGLLGSRIKPSNDHHRQTVATVNISELVPGDAKMATSTSCLWRGARGTGDRWTAKAGSRCQCFPQPHSSQRASGGHRSRLPLSWKWVCGAVVLVRSHSQEQQGG